MERKNTINLEPNKDQFWDHVSINRDGPGKQLEKMGFLEFAYPDIRIGWYGDYELMYSRGYLKIFSTDKKVMDVYLPEATVAEFKDLLTNFFENFK